MFLTYIHRSNGNDDNAATQITPELRELLAR